MRFLSEITYSKLLVTQTLHNSKLPLTWSNFHFPADHFPYNNFTLDNSNFFLFPLKVWIIVSWLYNEMNGLPMQMVSNCKLPFNTFPWCKDHFPQFTESQQVLTFRSFHQYLIPFMIWAFLKRHLVTPWKFCVSIVLNFFWDYCYSQKKFKTKVTQSYGGQTSCLMVNSQLANDEIWMSLNNIIV